MNSPALRKILIADDDSIYRERLALALREEGYEVITAGDTDSAQDAAHDFQPDAAVLDLRMPGDGMECLRRLLARHPGVRVLMLTGYGSIASALEAVRLGATDYLTKPADADQILHALEPTSPAGPSDPTYKAPSLERMEWEHIQRVLHDHGGNISHAADALGVHRRSLQRKLRKYPPPR